MGNHILVVDDEADVREFLAEFLTMQGYSVSLAADGPEALECVEKDPPRVILLDIRMPGMDGIEVLKRVKASHPDVGVIMVTAVFDEEVGKKALKLGADDYITKPLDMSYLETSLMVKLSTLPY
jgi:DNA-binding response OmpR family regulator